MSFLNILYTLLIQPLQLFFELVYMAADWIIGDPGLSIIALSLAMNFLVLPLYRKADAMQEEERQTELRLHEGLTHIKKTYKGDERMMILQTFYRQNDYKPTYVLKGATSLFLEIPFFIAAYRFLSGLELLHGVSFGPIADLGRPDGLLVVAGLTINVLPLIMTGVNLISCIIFTKGSLLKTKIQLYTMAIFFLFFLYTSPSGLVFYWTLNNLFSLIKTIFYKLKHSKQILCILSSLSGIALAVCGFCFYAAPARNYFVALGILLQIPPLWVLVLSRLIGHAAKAKEPAPNKKLFFSAGIFLALLTGLLIPSAVIKASPQEFVDLNLFYHPGWYLVSASCLAFGLFVVWAGIFYGLASPKGKVMFERVFWVLCGISIVDYMCFGKHLGTLSSSLKYIAGMWFSDSEQALNAIVVILLAIALWLIVLRWSRRVPGILTVGILTLACMSVVNVTGICSSINQITTPEAAAASQPEFTLSKNGKNVVVLMLDRSVGAYMPYIFNEKPELKEQFSGFIDYPNTISFGKNTNFGTPPLFGGYEYTPAKMNRRSDMLLKDKQDEALRVMPMLFGQNGYDVTVFDPPYAGYSWIPELSIYDDCPNTTAYNTKGKFVEPEQREAFIRNNKRNFFFFGLTKAAPLILQPTIYDYANYNNSIPNGQTTSGAHTASGMNDTFLNSYSTLVHLPDITCISEDGGNHLLVMDNEAAHEPTLLQEPEYTPSPVVDNTEFDAQHADRFTLDGRTMEVSTAYQYSHYQVNMATMLQLGRWFDYLKENGVYDNTRIILVSDHGREMWQFDDMYSNQNFDALGCNALLMVKDFNASGFTISDEFMTNADVPTLAMDGLIENPVNPFTGNAINSEDKTAHDQYILRSSAWNTEINNGTQFLPGDWYTVHDDIWTKSNWSSVAKKAIWDQEN